MAVDFLAVAAAPHRPNPNTGNTGCGAGPARLAQFLRRVTRKHQFASFRDMSHIFRAGTAIVLIAVITGHMPSLSPRWRAVAADLHQAKPQAKVKAAVHSLLTRKG